MTEAVNVLHLSDLHFGKEGDTAIDQTAAARRWNALAPLVARVAGLEPEWRPAIIAVSGDVGWRGAASDYVLAATFLTKLLDELELPRERLVLCAGNHDLDRSATVGMLPPPSVSQADDWLQVQNLANLARPFEAYAEFCTELDVAPLQIAGAAHSLIGQRDLLGLRFVVLNSAWFCRGDEDKGRLWIGLPQLQLMHSDGQLADPERYDDGPITIGLLHHPPHDLNDAENNAYGDRPATYRFLAERTHLLLSGHVHGAVEKATRHHQAAFSIIGGASYAGGAYRNNFSILRIAAEGRDVRRRPFEFDPRLTQWVEIDEEVFSLHSGAPGARVRRAAITPVHFRTERMPDEIDLQRAVHIVQKQCPIDNELSIPLAYDARIAELTTRLEHHYEHFREDMQTAGVTPDPVAFNSLRTAIDEAYYQMETLPRLLALFTDKISHCSTIRLSAAGVLQTGRAQDDARPLLARLLSARFRRSGPFP